MNEKTSKTKSADTADLIALLIAVFSTWCFGWTSSDLVWSSWYSGLILGILAITSFVCAAVFTGVSLYFNTKESPLKRCLEFLVFCAFCVFILVFFFFFFSGLNGLLGGLLVRILPFEGSALDFSMILNEDLGGIIQRIWLFWEMINSELGSVLGAYVLSVVIAERRKIFLPLTETYRRAKLSGWKKLGRATLLEVDEGVVLVKYIFAPFLAAFTVYLLAFVFLLAHLFLGDSSVVQFLIILGYFMPWSSVWKKSKELKRKA